MDGPDAKGNVTIRVNGVVQALQILGPQQLLLESMGMSTNVETQEKQVESPMPGKILQVMVTPGTAVDEGDPLLVLEAMKMENVIRAPRSGVIAGVEAQVGEAVEKAATLVTYEMNE
jgi:biotin carboxyl carrier protein